LISLSPFL
jgi:large subunit ribosomal protein L19e